MAAASDDGSAKGKKKESGAQASDPTQNAREENLKQEKHSQKSLVGCGPTNTRELEVVSPHEENVP